VRNDSTIYIYLTKHFPSSSPFYRKPKEPAFINNLQTYRNHEGLKFHITGNIKFTNTVIADKRFGIRYGAWNTCITFEDTYITGRSRDRELRLGKSCPMSNGVGIRASFNSVPGNYGQIALSNVTFSDFGCGVGSLVVTKIHAWGKIWGILFSRPM
jgi:hypothetical protein